MNGPDVITSRAIISKQSMAVRTGNGRFFGGFRGMVFYLLLLFLLLLLLILLLLFLFFLLVISTLLNQLFSTHPLLLPHLLTLLPFLPFLLFLLLPLLFSLLFFLALITDAKGLSTARFVAVHGAGGVFARATSLTREHAPKMHGSHVVLALNLTLER